MAARSTRRTIEGSITWMMNAEGVQGAGRTTRKGTKGASRNVQGREEVFANVSAGADTKANTLGAAAHLRLVIFVSLRMAASAVAPLFPM